MNRRGFLQRSAIGAAPAFAVEAKPVAPSDRIGVALVGCGGMGKVDLGDFQRNPETEVVAVCDVFETNLKSALALAPKAKPFKDYRRVLESRDVDAVIVATPDHWHALIAIDACNAGKDVYVEKPVSRTIREGRLMVEAARRNKRVVQAGIQQRAGSHFQRAIRAVHEGRIGDVYLAQVWNHGSRPPSAALPQAQDNKVPAGLDWDFWMGPARYSPFSPARRRFNDWWDTGGGMMTNWGTHTIDVIHWGMKATAPRSIFALGGNYHGKSGADAPDTIEVTYEYPGFLLHCSVIAHNSYGNNGDPGRKSFGSYGMQFHGTKGTMFVDRAGYKIIPQMKANTEKVFQRSREALDDLIGLGYYYTTDSGGEEGVTSLQHFPHVRNFLDCVKSRDLPIGDIEIGHRSTSACHLGNIAYRAGEKIIWDAESERVTNNAAADKLVTTTYRKPWSLPGLERRS